MDEIICPQCGSGQIKLNGDTHYGKQNHKCKICGQQFVINPENKVITDEEKDKIKKLLLERISLHRICRVMNVSLPWLLDFTVNLYGQTPDDIGIKTEQINEMDIVIFRTVETEADEMWSFVKNKKDKQ